MGVGIRQSATALLVAAVLGLGWAAPAQAAGSTATASGSASATIVAAVAAVELADLDFGAVASSPEQSGTVAISAGSDRPSYGGGARSGCEGAQCPAAHAARFAVTGEANRAYVVDTPASLSIAGISTGAGSQVLTVAGIEVRTDSRPGAGPHGRLDAAGTDSFGVGGVLQVPAGISSAHYRISIPVMLSYS